MADTPDGVQHDDPAAGREAEVGVVGSGSNLLIADTGVRGLVVKLDKELSRISVDGTRIECGGGARLLCRPGARLPCVSFPADWTRS